MHYVEPPIEYALNTNLLCFSYPIVSNTQKKREESELNAGSSY
jgi:hypothetical protein